MQAVFRELDSAREALERSVVAIGNFDGVHLGHQAVFAQATSRAEAIDATPVALTFEPHPVRYFRPDVPSFRLTTFAQRAELIGAHGLDVAALPFDGQMADLSPRAFVDEILIDGLAARVVIVGANFRFGRDRAGDIDVLRELASSRDLEVIIAEVVTRDGAPISSTRVREHLRAAELDEVTALLGRPHRIRGPIIHGDARGRTLGYPTANIDVDEDLLLPPDGIYAARLHLAGEDPLDTAAYLGWRPTFDSERRQLEAYVLEPPRDDFDLYAEIVELELFDFVRPDRDFDDPDELVAQIERDVAAIESYFAALS